MKLLYKLMINLLITSMMMLPFSLQARIISTEQAIASAQVSRDKVQEFVSRSDIVAKFESLGLTALNAQERVNAMTPEEVDLIANKIDSLPTGGYITETGGVIIGVTLIIIVALLTRSK